MGLLQELIRANTSNPPGNEAQVAELLRTRLEPLGFEVEIIPTPAPGKAHLIARLRAQNPAASRCCWPATRTSSASSASCGASTRSPGCIRGGDIFGRGAMDFKGGLAAFTVAASRLARAKVPLERDIVLLAEADEEGGATGRAGWRRTTSPRSTPRSRSTRAGGCSRTAVAPRA